MDLRNASLQYLTNHSSRVRAFPRDGGFQISTIKKGIVFVWATLSGAAQLALRALNNGLARLRDLAELEILIADNDDEMTQQFLLSINETPSGEGETFWINEGRIQARLAKYNEKDLLAVQDLTERLLFSP